MFKLMEQFMILTGFFLVRQHPNLRGQAVILMTVLRTLFLKLKQNSLIKKSKFDEVQNHYFTQLHNEQTMTMNFLS